jgi:uncharacterized protein (DUF1330 family)
MRTVNPSHEQFEDFARGAPDAAPVVMLNLLRFRATADYGAASDVRVSGRKAYARYSRGVAPLLWEVGGAVLWLGRARAAVIAPEGEAWDEVLLVSYPSRAAFVRMVHSEAYQRLMEHRTAALADSRLIELREGRLPRWAFRVARALVRLKARVLPVVGRDGG